MDNIALLILGIFISVIVFAVSQWDFGYLPKNRRS